MATRIKFCGITSLADGERAVGAGAWAIGLILWPGSPRACDPAIAAQIAAALKRRVEVAAVLVNPTLEECTRIADTIEPSMIQLHGDEGPAFCGEVARRTGARVIKAVRVRSGADLQALHSFSTEYHLLDSYVPGQRGGTGETFAWELAREHRGSVPLILSGGLTAETVGEAIGVVGPFAVDVASGVEAAPGIKDPEKLKEFVAAVHAPPPGGAHARPHGSAHVPTRTS